MTTQPPSSVTAGSYFGLVVRAMDGNGNVDISFNGSVTVVNQSELGELSGPVTVTAVNGVATFSGLMIDQANFGNSLLVSGDNLATAISNTFDAVCGTASQLEVFTPPPSNVSATNTFEVDVAIEDSLSNIQTGFNGNVTIVLANNSTGAALGGTITVTAVNGVAVFSDLTIDKPGSGYILQVTSNGLTAATSGIHVATVGVATQLVVTAQPPSTFAAGSSIGLVVTAEDSSGNVDETFNGNVTVFNPWDASLGGTLTVTAVNGVATFSGLTEDQAGSNNWLLATGAGLNSVPTNSFTVTALAATQLEVWGPDSNVLPGSAFGMTILAEDPYGNMDPSFSGDVTLALMNSPGGATLGGTLTVTALAGVASFSGLSIDALGTGYTLQAQSAGLTSATSASFDVTADQLVVTIQPTSSLSAGAGFGLTVAAQNGSGNVDTNFTGSVTVALIDLGGTGATLGGTLTATATGGMATFSGLTLNQAGSYVLLLTSADVGGTVTNSIIVINNRCTWDGGGANNLWKTKENWVGDVAPLPGDNLVFPAGAARMVNFNDYPSGIVFASITVSGSGYHFQGNTHQASMFEVQPNTSVEVNAIYTDTLTIGAGGVLTISPIPMTHTWDGCGVDNKWTTAANWVGGIAPMAGDNLIFPAGAAQGKLQRLSI